MTGLAAPPEEATDDLIHDVAGKDSSGDPMSDRLGGSGQAGHDDLVEMIPMIRTVADETGATVIDLHSALAGRADLFPDTVHPNDEGAKLMAAEIFRALTGKSPPENQGEPAASAQRPRRARQFKLFTPYFAWNNNFSGKEIGWQAGTEEAPQWTANFKDRKSVV